MHPTNILTPTDFSQPSLQAARLGLAIARRYGTTLTLLYVDHLPAFSVRMSEQIAADTWEGYLHERDVALRARLEELARTLDAAAVKAALRRDETPAAIVNQAADQGAELVVMAAHGAGESQRFLLGEVAFEVAANAGCPVLVVRSDRKHPLADDGQFRSPVVGAIDVPDPRTIALVKALAASGAQIDLLHVLELDEPKAGPPLPRSASESLAKGRSALRSRLERAARELADGRVTASARIEPGDAASTLLEQATGSQNDLIVIGARSLERAAGTLGVVARRVLRHSPVPVVIVPTQK